MLPYTVVERMTPRTMRFVARNYVGNVDVDGYILAEWPFKNHDLHSVEFLSTAPRSGHSHFSRTLCATKNQEPDILQLPNRKSCRHRLPSYLQNIHISQCVAPLCLPFAARHVWSNSIRKRTNRYTESDHHACAALITTKLMSYWNDK
jgi:hypothetical protein